MQITSTEFFKNIKKLPPPETQDYYDLINWELEKIQGGITINGVKISNWLYWHLNHWWIRIDDTDKYGNDIRITSLPELRDNEWIRAEALETCRLGRKGYMEVGGRQGGKSEMEASYLGMNATFFENTQNVIICGNDNDLSLLKDKVDFGLKHLWKGIAIPRLDKTWRTNQVRLGYKEPDGEDKIWSYIVIRNAKDGNNTEVAAGTTAKSFIMDEVGKYSFSPAYEAAKPAFIGKNGWRAVPILVGTGGAFDKGQDAERFFWHPEANNFLGFEDGKGKETCLFLSGLYRQDCKVETNLGTWLQEQRGIVLPEDSVLFSTPMRVADKEKALATINEERRQKKLDPDKTLYLKQVMYYPLNPEECFLSTSSNIFNIELAKNHQTRVYNESSWGGTPIEVYMDGEGVHHKISSKTPISNFPVKTGENKDAPVVMYEPPRSDPEFGLYVAGVDSYRDGTSRLSSSLGAVYIYKRMHNILSEKYQDMFVASYVARPDDKSVWEEQARLLIKYYNARTLVENDEISFIEYMKKMGDEYYLEPQPNWLKQLVPNTSQDRPFGVSRQADKVRNFLHSGMKKYMEEKIYVEKDDKGSVIKEVFGVSRIPDPLLLEEVIKYNEDDNFDRIIAAELAIAMANSLDPIYGKVGGEKDPRYKALLHRAEGKKTKSKLFRSSPGALFR